ncbi:MAG: ACP S-malonyltransferase, partial [candidate division Zixibacteria bacterium]|nr:ACP S-malonyltransferase [candidate division Zixibacteria bacterium]
YVGMGKDLYQSDSGVRQLYNLASSEIGEDVARLSFEGSAEKLKETRFTQPAILLHSLAVLTIMKDKLPQADLTAGHSLGEYGALAMAGVLSYEDALRAVIKRAALMEIACRKNQGTMAAIMGLEEDKIVEICHKASEKGIVVPANFNSSGQIVISGTTAGVEEACRLCREQGAKRAMTIPVGGAFHSPLMEPAQKELEKFLEGITFQTAKIDIVPNVTAMATKDAANLKKLLIEQLTSPVRWQQTMQFFKNHAIDRMIEVGPGKVLAGLAKRELEGAQIYNIDTLADIRNFGIG